MKKSLTMAAGIVALTGLLALGLSPIGAGPMPFPDDSAGGNLANHAGPMPFPDDSAGGNINS
jgi:hypothetical protein